MKTHIFAINRRLRSSLHTLWMSMGLFLILIIPLFLITGLTSKALPLLKEHPISTLIFSSDWKPLSGKFGFFPFIISSIWITILSLLISIPVCLLTSIHLTQYAKKWVVKILQPVIDILAGNPRLFIVFGEFWLLFPLSLTRLHHSLVRQFQVIPYLQEPLCCRS